MPVTIYLYCMRTHIDRHEAAVKKQYSVEWKNRHTAHFSHPHDYVTRTVAIMLITYNIYPGSLKYIKKG